MNADEPSPAFGRNQIGSRQEREERKGSLNEKTLEPWRSLRLCERHNFNVRNGLTEIRTSKEVLYETEEDV